jgi:hypothetical protein
MKRILIWAVVTLINIIALNLLIKFFGLIYVIKGGLVYLITDSMLNKIKNNDRRNSKNS